jgi:hypothetical protein
MQQLNIKIITVSSKIQPPQSNQKLISIQLYFKQFLTTKLKIISFCPMMILLHTSKISQQKTQAYSATFATNNRLCFYKCPLFCTSIATTKKKLQIKN